MPGPLLFLVAMMVIVAESVLLGLFSVQGWAVQTPIAIAIFLGLDRDFASGGAVLLALLFPVEWLVAGVYGVYSLSLVALFFAMQGVRKKVQKGWGVARGFLAALAALIHLGVMIAGLFIVGQGDTQLVAAVGWKAGSTVLTVAVMTVVLGRGLAKIDAMIDPRRADSRLKFL
jgi:hypothetical protein